MRLQYHFITLIFLTSQAFGQDCDNKINIIVIDPHEDEPLEYADIYIEELNRLVRTKEDGSCNINEICKGDYHISVHHAFCDPKKIFIRIVNDTILKIFLEHHSHDLEEVNISDSKNIKYSQSQSSIKENIILDNASSNLGNLLSLVSGVSSIKNGNNISKPVIHGLSGNRIGIYNNGSIQAGQQWGQDHAPELSLLSFEKIAILKGTDAIPYGGNGLGAIVLLEPSPIGEDPHMHGFSLMSFENNGSQWMQHARLEKSIRLYKWRFNIGAKQGGDRKTPDYYLTNTGNREFNSSVFITRNIRKLSEKYYCSYYHSKLGILRGSHVSNLTDLQNAFTRAIPLYTQDHFSYTISNPRQSVHHGLIKYSINKERKKDFIEFNLSGQINHRLEYDVRRNIRENQPSLSLFMQSYLAELKDKFSYRKFKINTGIQTRYIYNFNLPGTGIYPLIPDYGTFNQGIFVQSASSYSRIKYDLGLRLDYFNHQIKYYSRKNTQEIISKNLEFLNFSSSCGINIELAKNSLLKLNIGWVQRSPEINELFSNGLHQSVSGIEEGNENLAKEKSLKLILTHQYSYGEKFTLESNVYYHKIKDYIYLKSSDELRLTIRGAFPVYQYAQTDAIISGLDIQSRYEINNHWSVNITGSLIHSKDIRNDLPLVLIPTSNGQFGFLFQKSQFWKLRNWTTELSAYINSKSKVKSNQDFLQVPDAYYLIGVRTRFDFVCWKQSFNMVLFGSNLLNNRYRDYLNRLRYFSDAEGRNGGIILRYSF